KWAFENQFTARAAAIAVATSQRERRDCLLFAEVCINEATDLSLGLSCAKLGFGELARTKALRESLFKRALLVDCCFSYWLHSKEGEPTFKVEIVDESPTR